MRFDVLTLFPAMFDSYVGQSLLKKAIDGKLVEVVTHDIRDWSRDKHHKVDDRPFGGGPGMVLRVEPVVECVEAVQQLPWKGGAASAVEPGHLVVLSPRGRTLNQQVVEELAAKSRLLLLCGRYEGFDERVFDILQPDEVSLGDFILNGGEVAAMAVIDAVIRLVPGVLGDDASSQNDSFSEAGGQRGGEQRMLEFAQFTRPREFRGHEVPEILLNGNHQEIERWRAEQSYLTTRQRRSDLLNQPQVPSETQHRKE